MRVKLTKANVDRRCVPPEPGETNSRGRAVREKFYWDTDMPGYGLVVTAKGTKSYIVQRDVGGKSCRATIGRHGVFTPDEARKHAREVLVEMCKGVNPNAKKREQRAHQVTLREALDMHLAHMKAKRRAQRSMDDLEADMDRLLPDWMNRPLRDIRPNDCAVRHERISKQRGPYAANRAMTQLRACWNTASRRFDDLPRNPVYGVSFNETNRRREPIQWDAMPEWWAKVESLGNPIRRDLQRFILFTGLRRRDACTVRWEHVDMEAGTIHRPCPKGGEKRAFTVPVSAFVLDLLKRRQDENGLVFANDWGWVWPTRNRQGRVTHITETKELRMGETGQGRQLLPSAHRLRDTFATGCLESGVDWMSTKILMNHTLPSGDVTMGYIRPSVEHLRAATEKVAEFLLTKAGVEHAQEAVA